MTTSELDAYQADNSGTVPSLSASIARILLTKTPRHAWLAHPRLNPHYRDERKPEFDRGEAAHALLIGKGRKIAVLPFDDFRSKAAKEAREAAYAERKIPIKQRDFAEIEAMVQSARSQLGQISELGKPFEDGQGELPLYWQEGQTHFRSRLDWLSSDDSVIFDYKTTTNAHPDAFTRKIYDMGYDVQAAFYRRAVRMTGGPERASFIFIAQEIEAPYALSAIALTPAAIDMAERKVEKAIALWRDCMSSNVWPGYPARVCHVDPPSWAEWQWNDREAREIDHPEASQIKAMIDWQAPFVSAKMEDEE
jgi:hypothetical protein